MIILAAADGEPVTAITRKFGVDRPDLDEAGISRNARDERLRAREAAKPADEQEPADTL